MKFNGLTLLFLFSISICFGQTFLGKPSDNPKGYDCSFRINKDSSINFIYSRDSNGIYADHSGTIKKLNDTLYRISATLIIGQFYMKSFNTDTIYIQLKSSIAHHLDKILVEYADGKTRKQLQGYDRMSKAIGLLKIPVDKNLFNNKKGTDFITITINKKNSLTGDLLSFTIPFRSAASFTSGEKVEFDAVIKDTKLWTVGKAPLQTGHFQLFKKSGP